MKKLFFVSAFVAMVGFGLTSCKDKERCWIITTENSGVTVKVYFWGTAEQADAQVSDAGKIPGSTASKSKASGVAQSECNLTNPVK